MLNKKVLTKAISRVLHLVDFIIVLLGENKYDIYINKKLINILPEQKNEIKRVYDRELIKQDKEDIKKILRSKETKKNKGRLKQLILI